MTILTVAYALAPVGPDSVGGAEQIASALDHALAAEGHRSLVVACRRSRIAGDWIDTGVDPDRPADETARAAAIAATRAAVEAVLDREPVDLVHAHGLDFAATIPAEAGARLYATLHLPPDWYPPLAGCPGRWLQCVSHSQQRACPPDPRLLSPIGNGVDIDALAHRRLARRRGYALHLGRVCPEKGQHLALEAAHRAGIPLYVGGTVYPYAAHRAYFDDRVRPLLDRSRRFLGPLALARKQRLLAGAACLLIPSLAAETSSLVAMEAAACGTPVVAFRAGALPEIVEPGRTGFVVDDVAGMVDAIGQVHQIDSDTCRAIARRRFDRRAMTQAYLARYRELAVAAQAP